MNEYEILDLALNYLNESRKIKKGYWLGQDKYMGWDPDSDKYIEFVSQEEYDDWFDDNFGDDED